MFVNGPCTDQKQSLIWFGLVVQVCIGLLWFTLVYFGLLCFGVVEFGILHTMDHGQTRKKKYKQSGI